MKRYKIHMATRKKVGTPRFSVNKRKTQRLSSTVFYIFMSALCDVLLEEGLLGEVEEQRVVRGKGHVHAVAEELIEGVVAELEEKEVVRGGRHAKPDLVQEVEVP